MRAELTDRQLADWVAVYDVDSWGPDRGDRRTAQLIRHVVGAPHYSLDQVNEIRESDLTLGPAEPETELTPEEESAAYLLGFAQINARVDAAELAAK